MQGEQRKRTLTEDDINELLRRIDAAEITRWQQRTESIGYDVSTQESRAAIREDHLWVRGMRTGSSKVLKAGFGALGLAALIGFGHFIWDVFSIGMGALVRAKGGP